MASKEVINPGWDMSRYTYSPGIKAGKLLFISGHLGDEPEGAFPPDMKTQCDNAFRKIGEVLRAAGASWADVVKTTDYITTLEGYRDTAEVRRKYLGPDFPAATGVVVQRLVRSQALIEVEAIAVLD